MSFTAQDFSGLLNQTNEDSGIYQRADEITFTVLQVSGGQVLLPLLVLTVLLSKRVNRHPVFINFCVSWIVSAVTSCLLIYQGQTHYDPMNSTSKNSCIAQASLLNGIQGLTVSTTFAMVIHLWMLLFSHAKPKYQNYQKLPPIYTVVLLSMPYLVFFAFFLVSISFARDPMVMPTTWGRQLPILPVFICSVPVDANTTSSVVPCLKLQLSVSIFTLVISVVCVLFEVHAAIMIFSERKKLQKLVNSGWISMLLRLGFFSFFRTFSTSWDMSTMVLANESALNNEAMFSRISSVAFFLQASIPLVAFFTFATEKDIFRLWFLRKEPVKEPSEKSTSSSDLQLFE